MAFLTDEAAYVAEWMAYGPALASIEDIRGGQGFLGVDYTQNVDTRWAPESRLGPQINTLDCGSAGGTIADSGGAALSGGLNATLFLYVIRGTKWAKIKVSDMTLTSDGTETALSEAATSIAYTKNAGGTEVIVVGMDNTAFRLITAVGNGATDTHSAHASVLNSIMAAGTEGSQVPRLVGLGRSGAAGTDRVTVRTISLTSSVTPSGTWSTVDSIGPDDVTFTGFALDRDFWIVGTDRGPYYVDDNFNHFRELAPELGQDPSNCKGMAQISWIGCVIPTTSGIMRSVGLNVQGSVGPERYALNTSPIKGYCTGVAGNSRWAYFAMYDPLTDDSYICAVRPWQPGDWHDYELSYFPVAHFTDTNANFLKDIGTAGGVRTNPTLVGGYNDDIFYITQGRVHREPDDTNYRYNTNGGTLYLTELRRIPEMDKEVEYVEFESANCSATETLTVSLSVDGGTATAIGAPITTNGYQRIRCKGFRGTRIKPQIAFATGAATASPSIVGNFRLIYRPYDNEVDGGRRRR